MTGPPAKTLLFALLLILLSCPSAVLAANSPADIVRLELAAEQGDASAQYNLGLAYSRGDGVAVDYAAAAKWWARAAGQGVTAAQTRLMEAYWHGEGVQKDIALAVFWCRMAANQGIVEAQYLLSAAYYLGLGVPRDMVSAYMWASVAPRGLWIVLWRRFLAMQMSASQIDDARQMAADWAPQTPGFAGAAGSW